MVGAATSGDASGGEAEPSNLIIFVNPFFASRMKPSANSLDVSLEVNRKLVTVEVLVVIWPCGED